MLVISLLVFAPLALPVKLVTLVTDGNGEDGMAEEVVRFYAASVVSALEYLHSVDCVYRDLKMENLVLDAAGYPKLVDMGFAKIIRPGEHSYTKCGSPDYMAPELHLGKAHLTT